MHVLLLLHPADEQNSWRTGCGQWSSMGVCAACESKCTFSLLRSWRRR